VLQAPQLPVPVLTPSLILVSQVPWLQCVHCLQAAFLFDLVLGMVLLLLLLLLQWWFDELAIVWHPNN
jgi:hypothetical protein